MDISLMLRAAHRHALPTPIPRDGGCKFCQALAQEGGGPGPGQGPGQGQGQGQGAVAGAVQSTAPLSRLQSESASLQGFASGCQHAESGAAYLQWPSLRRESNGCAEERAAYFNGLLRDAGTDGNLTIYVPNRQQATTILDLMTVRAFHSKALRRHSLGSALGFRIRGGMLTTTPAIIVFVARKVHMQWLLEVQKLPSLLEGPGGVWCDVDVLEFSHYTAPAGSQKEQVHSDLVEGLRGNDPCIGSGSQVASQETYGTIGAVVRSQTGDRQLGFLTNRHVAVDLDYPNQKMFHPLPPNLGPGVFLGAVERATSFISDDLWYGIFAGMNPESFVRADGAFIPFADSFDLTNVSTSIKGVGEIGDVMNIDLQDSIDNVVGKHVVKVGRSSGLTKGVIMAYAVENNDENGMCFFTDLLIVGKDRQSFDLEGDSGSLVILCPKETHDKPRPIGIIWGGTANRGRLKLGSGYGPVNWTCGVDIGRLLKLLQLDLVTSVPGHGGDADDPDPEFERLEAGKNSVGGEKQGKPERREGTSELHGKQVATADSSAKPIGV